MPKLYFSEAIELAFKTSSFIFLRAGLYLAFGIGLLIYFGILFGLLHLTGGNNIATLIVIIATLGVFPILKFFKMFVIYLLQAAHIAVISQLLRDGKLPDGKGQIEYGKEFVMTKFKDVAAISAVDVMINAILKAFNQTIIRTAEFINFPGLEGLAQLINITVNYSVSYLAEAILSFIIVHKEENYWKGAKDGLILYVQSWKGLLVNSAVMGIINGVSFVVFFLILILPLSLLFPHSGIGVVVAIALAYLIKEALVYPVAMIAIIVTFYNETQGKEPDAEWEARLDSVSTKFGELKQKAIDFVSKPKSPMPGTT